MKIVFPYITNSYLMFESLLESLGHQVVVEKPNKETLSLGAQHAPEFACIPFKILLGTYIEALEKGADTIITSGGRGPCRAGHYAQLHEEILADLGYDFEMIVFEAPTDGFGDFFGNILRLTANCSWLRTIKIMWREWTRLKVLDELQQLVHKIRPRELKLGTTTDIFSNVRELVAEAETTEEIKQAAEQGRTKLTAIPQDEDYEPVKIGVVGEIYVVLEPFANLELEKTLGEMGVEVDRSIYLTDWTKHHSFWVPSEKTAPEAAQGYLNELIGGHAQETVGNTVLYSENGYDGVIQLAPFTCIPEIVAKSILPRVSEQEDIPVLSLFLDEQTGAEGLRTRLEAFVDMIVQQQRQEEAKVS